MFQQMINGSIAVLTKPSVSTFEEHERNNLTWALIYAVIAAVINAVIQALTAPFRLAQVQGQLEQQISDLQAQGVDTTFLEQTLAQAAQPNIIGDALGALIGTIIGSLILWGIIYLLGRAFGGTGQFGELAWGISLYSSPLAVIGLVLGVIPFVGWIFSFAASIYGLYLSYLAIQSGMNLPSNKALYVILILFLINIVLFCLVFGAIVLAAIGLGAAGGFAP
jgi:hypothetical protein